MTELRNFMSTSKFISRKQLNEKHFFYSEEIKRRFAEELEIKIQSKQLIEKLNKSLDKELTRNYEEVATEIEQTRAKSVMENLATLVTMFSEKMNERIGCNLEVRTKKELEKYFQEVEDIVLKRMHDSLAQRDPQLYINVSLHVSAILIN